MKAMKALVKDVYGVSGKYDAICLIVSEGGRKIGDLHFTRGFLTTGVICHESMHAALAWARRKGLSFAEAKSGSRFVTDGEELMVTAAGWLTRFITDRLVKLGLIGYHG
jgi:hypothetical protein